MSRKIDLDWNQGKHIFMHDQYEALNDLLIHTEELRHQHVNLFFTILAAILGIVGVVLVDKSPEPGQSWPIYLGSATAILLIGVYTFANVLQTRHISFILRVKIDCITLQWMSQRSNEEAYYHFSGLLERIRHFTFDIVPPAYIPHWRVLHILISPFRRFSGWLKNIILQARHPQRQLVFITSVNSLCITLILWLFANTPPPLQLPIEVKRFVNGLEHSGGTVGIALIFFITWTIQIIIYSHQSNRLFSYAKINFQKAKNVGILKLTE